MHLLSNLVVHVVVGLLGLFVGVILSLFWLEIINHVGLVSLKPRLAILQIWLFTLVRLPCKSSSDLVVDSRFATALHDAPVFFVVTRTHSTLYLFRLRARMRRVRLALILGRRQNNHVRVRKSSDFLGFFMCFFVPFLFRNVVAVAVVEKLF